MRTIYILFYLFLINISIVQAQNTDNFITEWNTTDNLTTISFNITSTGPVKYSWKTTDSNVVTTGELPTTITHDRVNIYNFPPNKTIEISLEPTNLKRFSTYVNYNESLINEALINLKQWGTATWTSMERAFYIAVNLKITATDIPNLSQVTNTALMFTVCTSLTQVPNINNWNTSNIVTMEGMFSSANTFNQDLNNWNTSNVTNMDYMFHDAYVFNGNVSTWNTSKVTNMRQMFLYTTAFNQNISNWDIGNIELMDNMLDNSGMDCSNYSTLLNAWATNTNTPNNITFGAGGRTYGTNVVAARNTLLAKGWNITDDTAGSDACNINLSANTFSKLEMQYHPNPVTDILNITHQDLIKKVELYTVLGQKIAEEVVNQKQAQINLAKHPKGLYLVKVYTTTANGSFKVTKQ